MIAVHTMHRAGSCREGFLCTHSFHLFIAEHLFRNNISFSINGTNRKIRRTFILNSKPQANIIIIFRTENNFIRFLCTWINCKQIRIKNNLCRTYCNLHIIDLHVFCYFLRNICRHLTDINGVNSISPVLILLLFKRIGYHSGSFQYNRLFSC